MALCALRRTPASEPQLCIIRIDDTGKGKRLGPYEILSAIGAGGMGEVYLAIDTRLNRRVAIKLLPPQWSSNPEMKARFDRESQIIAGLNHPHICTLHDVGQQDGADYLVMEYIEGQTLADRLAKGSPPMDQAVRSAIEIADALDRAHREGITHRDLKPGNVMLTKTGVKLLDFGLAKQNTLPQSGSVSQSLLATPLPEEIRFQFEGAVAGDNFDVSPDGRWIAYTGTVPGSHTRSLFLRSHARPFAPSTRGEVDIIG